MCELCEFPIHCLLCENRKQKHFEGFHINAVCVYCYQVVHLCLESEKTSTLLRALDFIPSQTQKTLIFTCSADEADVVCKVSPATRSNVLTVQTLVQS